jgi:hypothetical protein
MVTTWLVVIPAVTTAGLTFSMRGCGAAIVNPAAKLPVPAPMYVGFVTCTA